MNVPISWLQEYIDVPNDPQLLADKFTHIGYMLDRPPIDVDGDTVLDLEVRQNRSDCLSIIGLARELKALLGIDLRLPKLFDIDSIEGTGKTSVNIVDPTLCYRFETITISGIAIGDSPEWMKRRLHAYGIKSINNIVDITNYVMVEWGMPMHALDAQKVQNRTINIRPAKEGESITLLGGKTVDLDEKDLVIADTEGPMITTIMGSIDKSISQHTTDIILEAAVYNQANVRQSSVRQGIRTESSTRFEKFLHPHLTHVALARAAQLVIEIAGGNVADHSESYPNPPETKHVTLNLDSIRRLGGVNIQADTALTILNDLEIQSRAIDDTSIESIIPYFRTDIEEEADLVEEVIRIFGYDKIPELPLSDPTPADIQSKAYDLEESIRDIMLGLGYDEQITETLVDEQSPKLDPIMLENSLTSEKSMLRTNLEHSLFGALNEQKKYGGDVFKLFEVGKIYFKENDEFKEERHLGAIVQNSNLNYREVKGDMELLLQRLGFKFHAGQEKITKFYLIDKTTAFFDINIDHLLQESRNLPNVISAPLQNVISEDFSITARKGQFGSILEAIKMSDSVVFSISIVQGPTTLDDNMENIVARVSFYSSDTNLKKKDIEQARSRIREIIAEQ